MTTKTAPTRTLDEYLALPYAVRVVPAQPSGYVATVDELPGCITQAETWAEAGEMIRDAMRGWIGTALEDGLPVPEPREDAPPAKVLLRLPRSLHQALARAAEADGVSFNQFLVYQLGRVGKRDPLPSQHSFDSAFAAQHVPPGQYLQGLNRRIALSVVPPYRDADQDSDKGVA